jgi:hypothetical protein
MRLLDFFLWGNTHPSLIVNWIGGSNNKKGMTEGIAASRYLEKSVEMWDILPTSYPQEPADSQFRSGRDGTWNAGGFFNS